MINVEQIDQMIRKRDNPPKKCISIIKNLNYSCINNIKICNKIKEIPNNFIRYDIIQKCTPLKISEIDKRGQIHNLTNNETWVQLQYDNKKYDYQYFISYLNELKSSKLLFLTIIESYNFLFESILLLNESGICYLNLNKNNIIIYNRTIDFYPVLINFEKSIYLGAGNDTNDSTMSNFIINDDCTNLYPLELYVISYLNESNESISYSSIEVIYKKYIEHVNKNCRHISDKICRNKCIVFLKKYINKSKKEIINDLLTYWRTWDIYSISIFYLYIVDKLKINLNLNEKFIDNFILLLTTNINPLNRQINKSQYKHLLNTHIEWNFINEITDETLVKSNFNV